MRFLDDLELFRGDGSRNAKGETLEEFLDGYNAKKYDCPSNTVDMLVFRSAEAWRRPEQPLKLLMVRRSNHPSIGAWALPGGFVNLRESLADAAARELQEETGVTGIPLVQLRTWGEADRDPRWRVITTAYMALVEGDLAVQAGDDAADARWFDVSLDAEESEAQAADETKAAAVRREGWKLILTDRNSGLQLSARVERISTRRGILEQPSWRLLESNGIASDHALLITDGILYLRKCTEEG